MHPEQIAVGTPKSPNRGSRARRARGQESSSSGPRAPPSPAAASAPPQAAPRRGRGWHRRLPGQRRLRNDRLVDDHRFAVVRPGEAEPEQVALVPVGDIDDDAGMGIAGVRLLVGPADDLGMRADDALPADHRSDRRIEALLPIRGILPRQRRHSRQAECRVGARHLGGGMRGKAEPECEQQQGQPTMQRDHASSSRMLARHTLAPTVTIGTRSARSAMVPT